MWYSQLTCECLAHVMNILFDFCTTFLLIGERSVKHDLECQFLIATTNEKLQYDLLQEKKQLYNFSSSFTKETCEQPDRVTPLWVKVIVGLFRSYL